MCYSTTSPLSLQCSSIRPSPSARPSSGVSHTPTLKDSTSSSRAKPTYPNETNGQDRLSRSTFIFPAPRPKCQLVRAPEPYIRETARLSGPTSIFLAPRPKCHALTGAMRSLSELLSHIFVKPRELALNTICNTPDPAHAPLYRGVGPIYVATRLLFRPRFA